MKKKNILAENMRRFATKNLTEVARLDPRFEMELKDIYRKLQQGEFVTDEIIDEMGDFYEEVYESGDLKLIQLYDNLRSVAEDEPEDQFPPVIALMKYLDSSNLKEQGEPYQSLGQKGEIPMLDPEADTAHSEQTLDLLAKSYEQIKPKRLDMSEFKNDVRDLVSIYKDKPAGSATMTAYMNAFRELYPTVQTRSDFRGILNTVTSKLSHLLGHARSIEQGDTSNYGYRVHPWAQSKGI